ncbi:MAG: AraC family transcriptional regulator [Acinetobacter tandoii]|uniref:AraC family transcriptional regulator n=1 Tax=Acinetobacter tandoii TaxID=202954 RepID=UPI003D6B2409
MKSYADTDLSQLIEVHEYFYAQNDEIAAHSCIWGDFNFSLNGILDYEIEGIHHLSPPNYGLWIPAHTAHACIAREIQPTHYICIHLHPELCKYFPSTTKAVEISPFLRHLIKEVLRQKPIRTSAEYKHLLQVLLDQLRTAPAYEHYLPQTQHRVLKPILQQLSNPQCFAKSLQQILHKFQFTERHLLRLSQQELQLSLAEWRNRAKILYAIDQLHAGSTVKKLAYDLGYQHSSSFIEFFKRYTGQTPAQLRE